jgi:hypothetical protein
MLTCCSPWMPCVKSGIVTSGGTVRYEMMEAMTMTNCPRCQSDKIIPNVFIEDRGMSNVPWRLSVRVDEKPEAVIFKGRHTNALRAWICGGCGYAELYVSNPKELYEAYTKAQQR